MTIQVNRAPARFVSALVKAVFSPYGNPTGRVRRVHARAWARVGI